MQVSEEKCYNENVIVNIGTEQIQHSEKLLRIKTN